MRTICMPKLTMKIKTRENLLCEILHTKISQSTVRQVWGMIYG